MEAGSVAVSRRALICHATIDPRLRPLWVERDASAPAGDRRNRLTEGVSLHENEAIDRLLAAIRDVANFLKNDFPYVLDYVPRESLLIIILLW